LRHAIVRAPFACGSGPILRRNMPNYYYSNLHCQAFALVILPRAKRPKARVDILSGSQDSAGGAAEAGLVNDGASTASRAVPGHD
jgi:hypothetical protein